MDPPPSFLQDDYALNMLTHAAIHTHQTEGAASKDKASIGIRGPSTTSITNHQNGRPSGGPHLTQPRSLNILSDYNNPLGLPARGMDALAFNPPATGSQLPYLNNAFPGIGSQISPNYGTNLGILDAESYDDGRGALRNRRVEPQLESMLPFGVTRGSRSRPRSELRADSEEQDDGTRRKKKRKVETQNKEEEEEARRKSRGRPRVDTKDETAADRRRTQIRMAQRAYRHRKEITISSLEKQVQDLRSTNEEMNNIFINLYDFAIAKGLLQREPDFGQQLQSATERFLALAKASAGDDNQEEDHEGGARNDQAESGRRPRAQKTSAKKPHEEKPSEPTSAWGGFTVSAESPQEMGIGYKQQNEERTTQSDHQVITRPTEDNASFPFDWMGLQEYRAEVPEIQDYSQDLSLQSQLPLPDTYNYNEFSFARRIHRGAIERAFRLYNSTDPYDLEKFQRLFGFCLLYETKEAIGARLKRVLGRSTKETLQEWRAPFVHVGGAGTYYPLHDVDRELMPKFRTGYSMGPFSPAIAQAQESLEDDMKCILPGFQGEFFDPYDVEGYLRDRGLDIPPAAEFVTAELDLVALSEAPSPKSASSDSSLSKISPQTPHSPIGAILLDTDKDSNALSLDPKKAGNGLTILDPLTQTFPFPSGFTNWEKDSSMKGNNGFIDPIFDSMSGQSARRVGTPDVVISNRRYGNRQTVTINVTTLLEELIKRGVCLGRSPGFKPSDVDAAIIAAVNAGC